MIDFSVQLIISLAAVIFLAAWMKWHLSRKNLNACAAKIPGPPAWPILGNALQFMVETDKMLDTIANLMYEYGPVFRFWLGPELNVTISDPEEIEVLLMGSKTLTRGPSYKYMQLFLGEGLLSGSGQTWRTHRKIVNPAFGMNRTQFFMNSFNKHTTTLLESLSKKTSNKQFNIFYEVVEATTNSVCETLLGYTKNNKELPYRDEIVRSSEHMYEIVYKRMTKWWLQIDWIFRKTHLYKDQEMYKSLVKDFSKAILADRLADFEKTKQLDDSDLTPFDRLLKEAKMSEKDTIDEIFTLFTSSQESSATIASFTLLMLGMHPDYQEKVYNEVVSVTGKDDRDVTLSELTSMVYLDMAVKEVLRLFPIGTILQRQIFKDIEISSYTLPAGCSLVIPIYQIHRHPKYWDDPESFNPYRFTPENSASRHPMTYIPFSAGPMNCVGRTFATLLVKTICCRIIKKYQIHSALTMDKLKLKTDISVRPVNGYYVTIKARD